MAYSSLLNANEQLFLVVSFRLSRNLVPRADFVLFRFDFTEQQVQPGDAV